MNIKEFNIKFNEFIASLICFIHILIILCILIIPFINSNYLLFFFVLIIPFIQMHWLLNDDTCALTELEKFLRNEKDKNKCFTKKYLAQYLILIIIKNLVFYVMYC